MTKKAEAVAPEPVAAGSELSSIGARWPVLAGDVSELSGLLAENLGGETLKPWELPRVHVPAGGATFWSVPTLDNPDGEPVKELEAIIVAHSLVRQYFSLSIDESGGAPPDCYSPDSRTGFGTPGGDCAACTFAQFGSAVRDDGTPGAGQACSQRRLLYLLRPGDVLPMLLSVPPSSLQNSKKYLLGLLAAQVHFAAVVTKLGLERVATGGQPFSRVTFKTAGRLSPEEAPRARALAESFRRLLFEAPVGVAAS